MPSKSPAQHRLMEAVAHNPGFAKQVGIPQSVGQEFSTADQKHEFDHVAHTKQLKADAYAAPARAPMRRRVPR